MLGLFGAALFCGESIITPAISVLSAVEGLEMMTPPLTDWVIPATMVIVFGLFAIQRHGTGRMGRWFGPIMAVWFLTLGRPGDLAQLPDKPSVLAAMSPIYAVTFFLAHPLLAFLSLGSVVLAITGIEALYADMGHFGRTPVRLAWIAMVLPALTLNYFGQGALLLSHPDYGRQPLLPPGAGLGADPPGALATLATVIASQAVISGTFSLIRQAIQLGYLPRIAVQHTSERRARPDLCPGDQLGALRRGGCAGAELRQLGVAGRRLRDRGHRHHEHHHRARVRRRAAAVALGSGAGQSRCWASFWVIDLAFFGANLPKLGDGGWLPLVHCRTRSSCRSAPGGVAAPCSSSA